MAIQWFFSYFGMRMNKISKPFRVDHLPLSKRRALMGRIRNKHTRPEQLTEKLLRSMNFRYVLHDKSLPGTPDFLLPRHDVVILVHGCFWHRHTCRRGRSMPTTRRAFWERKLTANAERDKRTKRAIRARGYRVLEIWECSLKKPEQVKDRIRAFVHRG
jgi:DNA mismatch endonuclease (patch repair protein)